MNNNNIDIVLKWKNTFYKTSVPINFTVEELRYLTAHKLFPLLIEKKTHIFKFYYNSQELSPYTRIIDVLIPPNNNEQFITIETKEIPPLKTFVISTIKNTDLPNADSSINSVLNYNGEVNESALYFLIPNDIYIHIIDKVKEFIQNTQVNNPNNLNFENFKFEIYNNYNPIVNNNNNNNNNNSSSKNSSINNLLSTTKDIQIIDIDDEIECIDNNNANNNSNRILNTEVIDLDNEPDSVDLTISPPISPKHNNLNFRNPMNNNLNDMSRGNIMHNLILNIFRDNIAHKRRRNRNDDSDDDDSDSDSFDEDDEDDDEYMPNGRFGTINFDNNSGNGNGFMISPGLFSSGPPPPPGYIPYNQYTGPISRPHKKPNINDQEKQQSDLVTLMNEIEKLKKEKEQLVKSQTSPPSNNLVQSDGNNPTSGTNEKGNSQPTQDNKPEQDKPLECPICFEKMKSMSSTSCGHVFCSSCINAAIKRRKLCPVCNTKLAGKKAIHPLFL